jgi:saccharopine dehydrogenase (NAD+, L-lysine-forming)
MKGVIGKIVVVGAGGQGGSCASILARDKDVAEVVLADIDLDLANKVKSRIKSDKITAIKVDAGKVESVESATKGADAIINLTLPRFNMNIMKAALRNKAHYVDTAFCDSAVPYEVQMLEHKPLELDDEFKQAGLTALLGCGASPGVTNVLIKYACDKLDRVDKIFKKPRDIISAWDPGWSPATAIRDWAQEPIVFENGEYKKYPPFSGREEYNFEPFGTVLLCYHEHEEQLTLPRFIGKGVEYTDFKYPVDIQAGNFIKLGFGSDKPVDVKGVKILPVDVLTKLVQSPANAFFAEDETIKLPIDSVKLMSIRVEGMKSGESIEYTISYPYTNFVNEEQRLAIFRRFGTINIYVGLPVTVGAKMCIAGEAENGVISPECLDPIKFLKKMSDMGCPLKFQETLSKEVVVA